MNASWMNETVMLGASVFCATAGQRPETTTTVGAHLHPSQFNRFWIEGDMWRSTREIRDRLRAACFNLGLVWPEGDIVITGYRRSEHDAATLAAILSAGRGEHLPFGTKISGELALDGRLSVR